MASARQICRRDADGRRADGAAHERLWIIEMPRHPILRYMFAVMQIYWSMLAAQVTPVKAGARELTVPKREIEGDGRVH